MDSADFQKRLYRMFESDPPVLEELIDQYVFRAGYVPDQDMPFEDVAYREGQKALIMHFVDIARGQYE